MDVVEGATRVIVDDEELLHRGIIVEQWIIFDNNLQRYRLTSAAFKDSEISVDIASKTTPQESLDRLPKHKALASLVSRDPKELECDVVTDPKVGNPAHALILIKSGKGRVARLLAKKCNWSIPPDGYDMYEPVISKE